MSKIQKAAVVVVGYACIGSITALTLHTFM